MTDPTTTDDRWHLRKERSDRGFAHLPHIPSEYGGHVSVSESSAASGPHVWLRATAPVNLNDPAGPTHEVPIHLTADNALRVAEQLQLTVREHYQGRPADGDYRGQVGLLAENPAALEVVQEWLADPRRPSAGVYDSARDLLARLDTALNR